MSFRRKGFGSRVDSPREAIAARRLDQAVEADPRRGKPVTLQSRPFSLDTTAYLKAAAGAPAWSQRLVRIERLRSDLEEQIRQAHQDLLHAQGAGPAELSPRWQAFLKRLDLAPINQLIDKHNAFYPIEAGLGMEWPSGRYLVPPGMQYPLPRLTAESLVEDVIGDSTDLGQV
jgi:hypothetical protein